ncbi:MAG: TolC family protein [Candidatus Aadella gelida]|nr:TolC family protein [Candidatus Aadella gelida]
MKKHLIATVLIMSIVMMSRNGHTQDGPVGTLEDFPQKNKVETLQRFTEEAINNNSAIQESYGQWEAAVYKARQASSFPDPMAKYTYFGESVETRVGPQEHKYGVSQKIPFPIKLSMKEVSESRYASMLKENYEAAIREIVRKVKFVYYDIYWVDKAIQVTEGEKAILENLEEVTQRRYESKFAPQQDVIKAQVEISNLINRLLIFRQNRKSLVAKFNSVLNRQGGTKVGRLEDVQPMEFEYKLSELHTIAGESRQELLAARLNIERSEYEKSLAMMDYVPDLTVGFDYIQVGKGTTMRSNDGQDAWMTTFSINVPLWLGRISDKVKEKKSLLNSSKKNYENVQNEVYYEVEDIYFKIITYKDVIMLYETALIPQSEQAFDAAKTSYETGRVDFLNWLESERVLLQTRLAYYKSIVDYQKSIAYLERVIGTDLQGGENVSE